MPHMDLLEGKLIFVLLYSYEVLTTSTLGWFAIPSTSEAEREEELKSLFFFFKRLLKRVKEESEQASLKLRIKNQRSWHPAPLLQRK